MFHKLLCEDTHKSILAVAKLNQAIVDKDTAGLKEVGVVRRLLDERIAAEPTIRDTLLLDFVQSIWNMFRDSVGFENGGEATHAKMAAIISALIEGQDTFPSVDDMWALYDGFTAIRAQFNDRAAYEGVIEVAGRYHAAFPLLEYLAKREALNLLLRSTAFVALKDLADVLVLFLEATPEEVRMQAEELGGDLFFYALHGVRV